MKNQITTVHKTEYPEITELWEASVRATHHFLKEEDIQFFKPLILNEFLDAVQLSCTKNDTGKITGFMGVAEGKLEMLFIAPEARGTGIGKQLLAYAIEHLKVTLVDVNEDNPQAVGFYQHMGFETVSRAELDGMGKPYPLLHMKLAL